MFPSIPITLFGILTAIGFVLASFLFWRSLKDDFPEEEILTLAIWLALGGILGGRLSYAFFHPRLFLQNPAALFLWSKYSGFSLLGVALGIWGVLGVWGRKKDWDVWLTLDKLVEPLLLIVFLGSVGAWLGSQEAYHLGLVVLGILGFLGEKFYLSKYRSFAFYPSGKVGFMGLATTILFFSLVLPLDFCQKNVLSWEAIGYLVIILVLLGLLYKRSERKIREDLKKFYAKSNSIN